MKKYIAAFAVSVGAFVTHANAVIVTYSPTEPVANVQISNPLADPLPGGSTPYSALWTSAENRRDIGQTFRVAAEQPYLTIYAISVWVTGVNGDGTNDRPFSFIIESFSQSLANNQVGASTVIATESGILPKISGGVTNQYMTFTLDTPVTLNLTVDGTNYYGFRLSFDDDVASSNVTFQLVNGNTFSNGVAYKVDYTYPGGIPTPSNPSLMGANYDLAFAVIGIPEPSTALLVGLGLAATLLLRHRRNG